MSEVTELHPAHQVIINNVRAAINEQDRMRRALDICVLLANTPPEDWLSKATIHAELAEFRHQSPV